MHGSIVVNSVYKEGSSFIVSIDQLIVKNPTIKLENEKTNENSSKTYEGKKVLLVDDNALNLKVAQRILAPYKLSIVALDNGEDTVKEIKNGNVYDLILLDDMMPHKSGSETLKELRN